MQSAQDPFTESRGSPRCCFPGHLQLEPTLSHLSAFLGATSSFWSSLCCSHCPNILPNFHLTDLSLEVPALTSEPSGSSVSVLLNGLVVLLFLWRLQCLPVISCIMSVSPFAPRALQKVHTRAHTPSWCHCKSLWEVSWRPSLACGSRSPHHPTWLPRTVQRAVRSLGWPSWGQESLRKFGGSEDSSLVG
jgi:hypothetical protein